MRVQSRSQTTVSVLFIISILLVLLAAVGSPSADTAGNLRNPFPAVTCPSPTTGSNGQCQLTKDEPLQKTLRLVSNTTLDCHGHTLKPTTSVPPGPDVARRSTPEVAIFLDGVENVKILNCKIIGFDFGIFAINSKVLPDIRKDLAELVRRRNIIARNTINARFAAISLASVDNTEIGRNIITYTTAGGRGLYVGRDSDLNRILNNTITGDIAAATSPPGRFCYDDGDCNILGTTGSSCSNPSPPTLGVFWVSDGNDIDKNRIFGTFSAGIATTGSNTLIHRNTITGTGSSGSSTGINLAAKFALETTTVTRNVVSNVGVALALNNTPALLQNLPASAFGARVTLNDFTNFKTSVLTDIVATVSADGRGNFWGLPCRRLGGFNPALVKRFGVLLPNAVVTDDHPYGISVAQTPGKSLRQPCR